MSRIGDLKNRMGEEPGDYSRYKNMINMYKNNGMYMEAIEALEKLHDISELDINQQCDLAKCYMKVKEYEKGRQSFLMVLERDPDNIFALQHMAKYCLHFKEYVPAKTFCARLLALNKLPHFLVDGLFKQARKNEDTELLISLYETKYYLNNENVNEIIHYVNYLYNIGKYDETIMVVNDYANEHVIEVQRMHDLNMLLVKTYIAKKEYQKAKELLVKLLDKRTPSPSMMKLLTDYSIESAEHDFAVPYLQPVVEMYPNQHHAWEQLARVHRACGNDVCMRLAIEKVNAICMYHIERGTENKQYEKAIKRCFEYDSN